MAINYLDSNRGSQILRAINEYRLASQSSIVEEPVSLVEGEDYTFDAGNVKPKIVQIFDEDGNSLGFNIEFDETWKIIIPSTDSTQDATINILY